MQVRDAMSTAILAIGPDHTLREAARMMSTRRVGAAAVIDPDTSGIGILTERDILNAIGTDLDPDVERTADHITWEVVYAGPEWTLDEAAEAMTRGGFRHLIVIDESGDICGVVSVRDIVRVWSRQMLATKA